MRRVFEWIGGFAIVAFSFYFTDKVSLLVAGKSDLMQEIKAVSSVYEEEPIDAVINIEDNTVIPGKFGRTVNSRESYIQMHDFGSFNENYLVYDYIKPEKSLDDYKDMYITKGNKNKRQVSIIVNGESNPEILSKLKTLELPFSLLMSTATPESEPSDKIELINAGSSKEEFNSLNAKLKGEPKLCLKDLSNEELCKKNKYYLIDPELKLTSTNTHEIKNSLGPGAIILFTSSAKVENLNVILNELEYKDLSVVHISELIDEKGRSR